MHWTASEPASQMRWPLRKVITEALPAEEEGYEALSQGVGWAARRGGGRTDDRSNPGSEQSTQSGCKLPGRADQAYCSVQGRSGGRTGQGDRRVRRGPSAWSGRLEALSSRTGIFLRA